MSRPDWETAADLVVVGSGVAGLTAALTAQRAGLRVVVVTKDTPDAGSTRWAQGGIAVVLGDVPGDSVAAHLADTVAAGGGLVDEHAARMILEEGPDAVAALRGEGAVLDGHPDRLARTREGGHAALRVVHAGGDATGAEVERALLATLAADCHSPVAALARVEQGGVSLQAQLLTERGDEAVEGVMRGGDEVGTALAHDLLARAPAAVRRLFAG